LIQHIQHLLSFPQERQKNLKGKAKAWLRLNAHEQVRVAQYRGLVL
jgi:hypothetical protein